MARAVRAWGANSVDARPQTRVEGAQSGPPAGLGASSPRRRAAWSLDLRKAKGRSHDPSVYEPRHHFLEDVTPLVRPGLDPKTLGIAIETAP